MGVSITMTTVGFGGARHLTWAGVLAVCAVVLAACQTTKEVGSPTGPVIHAKRDMTAASAYADFQSCGRIAQDAPYERVPVTSSGGGLIGAIAAGAVAGVINGMRRAEARRNAWNSCINARNYEKVEVPDEVASAFREADTDEERIAVLDRWMASTDYTRITDWFETDELGTAEAYRTYLAKYPEGEFRYQALTRASALDNEVVALSSVRESAVLKAVIPDLYGLSRDGWTRAGVHGDGPLDCGEDIRAEAELTVTDGVITGRLKSKSFRRWVRLRGQIGEDGTVELSATWPHEDPLRFEGSFNQAGLIEGRLRATSSAGCDQPVWFEALRNRANIQGTGQLVSAPTTLDQAASSVPALLEAPATMKSNESTWVGEAIGSGTRTEYGRIFCTTSNPNRLEIRFLSDESFSGTMLRSWDGAAAEITGTIDGTTIAGRIRLPSSFTDYVIAGTLGDGIVTGTVFAPNLTSCTATFVARSPAAAALTRAGAEKDASGNEAISSGTSWRADASRSGLTGWHGRIVSDGVRGEYWGVPMFCHSQEPVAVNFEFIDSETFTASFVSPKLDSTVRIEGSVSGNKMKGNVAGTGYDEGQFVFIGDKQDGVISGKIYSPKLILCSSRVDVALLE
jgi:hypothetical protein